MKYIFTLFLGCALFVLNAAANDLPFHHGHAPAPTAKYPVGLNDGRPSAQPAPMAAYAPAPKPQITSFTPTQADSGTVIEISGLYFTGATSVSFGGVPAAWFHVLGDTAIEATVGFGATGSIIVTTPDGTDTAYGFTFLTPADRPHITQFIPTTGKTGDTIFVRGSKFTAATQVEFGGTYAADFHVLTDTTLWAVIGPGSSGAVSVFTAAGSGSLGGFTYIASPTPYLHLTSFSPTSGKTNDTVYIHGTGLEQVSSVTLGGVPAQFYDKVSDSLLLAVVGTGATGKVVVQGSNGQDSLPGFVYIPSQPDTSTPPPPPGFSLLSFNATDSSGGILLTWVAAHDQPVLYYFLMRGSDSANITHEVITVSSRRADYNIYTYQDNAHLTGTQYYQLRMEDSTGSFSYGPIVTVLAPPAVAAVRTFPNPAIGSVTIGVPQTNGPSWFLLSDPSGRVVRSVAVPPNTLQVTIDVSGLTKGLYKIGWSDGSRKSGGTIFIAK